MMKRPKVLVIDDDTDFLALLSELLENDFEIECAAGGLAGLVAAHDSRPDVIVLDLSMPGVGGWDVVRALRGDERTSDIPIVILTGVTEPDRGERAAHSGCEFLQKPLRDDLLIERIHSLIQRPTD